MAIGSGSRTYEANEVSFGSGNGVGGPATRKLTNVSAGSFAAGSTEAINGGQLFQALSNSIGFLGGGAALGAQGVFVAPTYVIQGASYSTVGDALSALDSKVSEIDSRTAGSSASVASTRSLRSASTLATPQAATLDADPAAVTATADTATVASTADATPSTSTATTASPTAVGSAARANDVTGTAIGGNAYAHGPNDTAIGSNTRVDADGSTAIGANAHVAAVATNAVAIGEGATVSAASSTAVGQGASATAQGAVAIGQGSLADRANTVSVGSVGAERQVTNVAAGTQDTDAVNKAQLDSGVTRANAYTDQRYSAMADTFEAYQGEVDDRFRRQDKRIDQQGAMNAAMLNMATSAAGIRTDNRLGVGLGFQGSRSALSIGYQRAISERATVTFGGAFGGDEAALGIGAGLGW